MGCFSLAWLEQLLIWLVVILAVVAFIRLVVPLASGAFAPYGGLIVQVLNIIIGAIIAIAVIIVVFDLLSCLVGVPRLR